MKKIFICVLLMLFFASGAQAQTYVSAVSHKQPAATSQSIISDAAGTAIDITGYSQVLMCVSGTYAVSGTGIVFEASPNASTYFTILGHRVDDGTAESSSGALTNISRCWNFNTTGMNRFRTNVGTGWDSGTVAVLITPVAAPTTSNPITQPVSGTVAVSSAPTTAVTGTFWQATQPVSGTFWQGTQPVSIASVPSHDVTNIGTFAVQAAQSGTWTVQPGNTANTTAWLVTGTGGTFPVTGTFWQATQPVSGTVTVGTFPDNEPFNVAQINGVAPLMGNGVTGTGSQRVTIASDNTAFSVNIGTFPDNEPFNLNQVGGAAITTDTGRPLDAKAAIPVRQPMACTSVAAVSQTADAQVVTGTAGQRIYICSILLVAAAAETINIISGTGTTCATTPTALFGSTTEASGLALAANGGFSMVSGNPFIRSTVDGDNLCITQVGTGRIAGTISYVVAAND